MNGLIVKSGKYLLKKVNKTQAQNIIRDTGVFEGFICGNKVNPFHISDGWGLGHYVKHESVDEFNTFIDKFNMGLEIHMPELGRYASYYQIQKTIEKNKDDGGFIQ